MMIAPNGKKSKLSPGLWRLVRTPEFKAWFGDWENDPANASKVLDENGEPRVVYHGSRAAGTFCSFKPNHRGLIWAASKYETAMSYTGLDRGGVIEIFLNIRNPIVEDLCGICYYERADVDGEGWTDWFGMNARRRGRDGGVIKNVIDDGGELDEEIDTVADNYVVFDSLQVMPVALSLCCSGERVIRY